MPRTKEQFEDMRGKSKKKMMDTALEFFSQYGYHATSISKIAKEAGIAKGLVYNYFGSKEELLSEIIKREVNQFNELFHAFTKEAVTKNDVISLIEQIFEAVKQHISTWKLFFRMMLQPEVSELAKHDMADFSHHVSHFSVDYFTIKGESNPTLKAKALAALLHGAFFQYMLNEDDEMLELAKNEIFEKFL